MFGQREQGGAGGRLNPRSGIRWDLPLGYRGSILRGDAAATRASLVSGPFRARPPTYFTPLDLESLRRVLEQAFERGWPIIPRGAGTGMPGGNLGPHAIVEVGPGFERVEWVDPEQGLIRAGAGAIAIEVDRFARERGWFVPFLPSSATWCRVGGMVANNAAGARSFRYGAAAASVVEVEGLFADGTAFRLTPDAPLPEPFSSLHGELAPRLIEVEKGRIAGWPAVRKNASGYALDRFIPSGDAAQLMVGSEGTLGLITDVVLRLQRVPEEIGLAVLPADSPEALTNLAAEATVLGTTTCEFLGSRFLDMAELRHDPRLGDIARGAFALV
ncbi:MAG: FAD-binding oxidoreductase, partial [Gemmatimonadota bacterium]